MGRKTRVLTLLLIWTLAIGVPLAGALAQDAPERTFFTLNLVYRSDDPTDAAIAKITQAELAKIGIDVRLHTYEWGTLLDRIFFGGAQKTFDEGGWDLHICYWIYDVADVNPRSVWHSEANSPAGFQPYGYNSGRVDALIEAAERTFDLEVRGELYRRMQEEIFNDHPYAFLYIPKFAYLLDEAVENFEPIETLRRLSDVRIAGKTEADDTQLIFQMGADVKNIGPILPKDTWTIIVSEGLYNPLIRVHKDPSTGALSFAPDVAESFEVSPDGRRITFRLRRDVRFHDGTPLTARDVKMTIDAHRAKDTGSVRYAIVATALGDLEVRPDAVQIVDDYTVVLHLEEPFAPLLSTLTFAGEFGIAPYHIWGQVPRSEWVRHWMNTGADGRLPIGTGPYRMVSWAKDEYIELEASPYYHGAKPFVDRWFFRIIPERATAIMAAEKGEVDIVHYQSVPPAEVERLKGVPNLEVLTYLHPGFNGIGFNMNHPVLNNVKVRWAISYALPRQHIIDNVLHGMGAHGAGPVPVQVTWAYNEQFNSGAIPHDLDRARALMEEAGYRFEYLEDPPAPAFTVTGFIAGIAAGAILTWLVLAAGRRRVVQSTT
ncbi:MAG TPA: ABC transporter substrate-binding protein [Bacillota bacterium]|nr:ABC transporter substrate-binding protein [Bacillota bacterium]